MNELWELQGTPAQNQIVIEALEACDFPFPRLVPKLQAEKNKSRIPVEWADLSVYGVKAMSDGQQYMAKVTGNSPHNHVHHDGDTGHPIEVRNRVLGLAWYSGKVSLDLSLLADPLLAKEVFLSEGAHMVDFFYMTDEMRGAITSCLHNFDDTEHGHGWFDVGTYREWLGEAFMGTFIKCFAPSIPVTIPFAHPTNDEQSRYIRSVLLGPRVFKSLLGKRYHDSHRWVMPTKWFLSSAEADRQGLLPCRTCKPQRSAQESS